MLPYQVFYHDLLSNQQLVYIKTTQHVSEVLPNSSQPVPIAEEPLVFQENELHRNRKPDKESYQGTCFPEENFELIQLSEQGH